MLLHVHGNHKACQGREAQDGHLDFHTASEFLGRCLSDGCVYDPAVSVGHCGDFTQCVEQLGVR